PAVPGAEGGPRLLDPEGPELRASRIAGPLRARPTGARIRDVELVPAAVAEDPVGMLGGERGADVDRVQVLVDPGGAEPGQPRLEVRGIGEEARVVRAHPDLLRIGRAPRVGVESRVRELREADAARRPHGRARGVRGDLAGGEREERESGDHSRETPGERAILRRLRPGAGTHRAYTTLAPAVAANVGIPCPQSISIILRVLASGVRFTSGCRVVVSITSPWSPT